MPEEITLQKAPPARVKAKVGPRRSSLVPLADSYLFWNVCGSALRGLGWFAGLFLAFAVVTGSQRVVQKGVPLVLAFEAIALQAPRIVMFTIPASLLFGVVSTFTEMSSKGEITALMAGGMSLRRMMRAPMFLALIFAIFAFWLQEKIVPGAELRKDNVLMLAARSVKIKDGFKVINTRPNGAVESVWQAESFDGAQKLLIKPVVVIFNPDNTVKQEIKAESAVWVTARKMWLLKNANVRTNPGPVKPGSTDQTRFAEGQFETWLLQTEKSPEPAAFKAGASDVSDEIKNKNFEMVSLSQLTAYRATIISDYAKEKGKANKNSRKDLRKEIRADTYGIHDKFATPLIVLAMVMFGAPLGVRSQRTASAGLAMGLSLMVILGYYLLWTMCTSIGKGGVPFPELLAYFPAAVLMTLGTVLIARKS